ncbi:hypothetical protein PCE1_001359 [Barthelona sp. PCE]
MTYQFYKTEERISGALHENMSNAFLIQYANAISDDLDTDVVLTNRVLQQAAIVEPSTEFSAAEIDQLHSRTEDLLNNLLFSENPEFYDPMDHHAVNLHGLNVEMVARVDKKDDD